MMGKFAPHSATISLPAFTSFITLDAYWPGSFCRNFRQRSKYCSPVMPLVFSSKSFANACTEQNCPSIRGTGLFLASEFVRSLERLFARRLSHPSSLRVCQAQGGGILSWFRLTAIVPVSLKTRSHFKQLIRIIFSILNFSHIETFFGSVIQSVKFLLVGRGRRQFLQRVIHSSLGRRWIFMACHQWQYEGKADQAYQKTCVEQNPDKGADKNAFALFSFCHHQGNDP